MEKIGCLPKAMLCRMVKFLFLGNGSEGARYAKHWAYEKPVRAKVPFGKAKGFVRNPIDSFVLAQLEKQRDGTPLLLRIKARWLRRVSLGLTGLPPPSKRSKFLADDSPEAREKVVDRLLAPLPVMASTGQGNGWTWPATLIPMVFQADQLRDSWAFRDWVIKAMNADMPFDQFTIEQLAGDLLPEASVSQKIATGFHRTPTCSVEAGVHPEENRVNQVFDRVNATGLTWLGTTLESPSAIATSTIPFQEEYYQLFAFFNHTPLEVRNKSGKAFPSTLGTEDGPALGHRRKRRDSVV